MREGRNAPALLVVLGEFGDEFVARVGALDTLAASRRHLAAVPVPGRVTPPSDTPTPPYAPPFPRNPIVSRKFNTATGRSEKGLVLRFCSRGALCPLALADLHLRCASGCRRPARKACPVEDLVQTRRRQPLALPPHLPPHPERARASRHLGSGLKFHRLLHTSMQLCY